MKGMGDDDLATPAAVAAAAAAVSGPTLLRDQSPGNDAASAADRRAVAT
jgi:hypothetical protein